MLPLPGKPPGTYLSGLGGYYATAADGYDILIPWKIEPEVYGQACFKSSIISPEEYLPPCCRYIELNPLPAGMVTDPVKYRWSGLACKLLGTKDLDVARILLSTTWKG